MWNDGCAQVKILNCLYNTLGAMFHIYRASHAVSEPLFSLAVEVRAHFLSRCGDLGAKRLI